VKNIDRDFFRGMVHERAEGMPPLLNRTHAATMIEIARQCLQRGFNEINHSAAIDALCHIAALCERAAVDLILPNCSTQNKVTALRSSKPKKGKST
jgi:hypothetical protein